MISEEVFRAVVMVVILTTVSVPVVLSRLPKRLDTHPLAQV